MTYDELVVQVAKMLWGKLATIDRSEAIDAARAIIPIVQDACAQVAEGCAVVNTNYLQEEDDYDNAFNEGVETSAQAIRDMGAGS